MDIPTKIKLSAKYSGITMEELAREALDVGRQTLYSRLNTGKFSTEDLNKIAEAMGAKFEFHFVFPNGTKV